MAKGDLIPHDNHVLRHVGKSKVEQDGRVNGAAFMLRSCEEGLSVQWRQAAGDGSVADQLQAILRVLSARRKVRKTDYLVELPVGQTRARVLESARQLTLEVELRFEHHPIEQDEFGPEDPFHSEIRGIPELEEGVAMALGDIIAECVSSQYSVNAI